MPMADVLMLALVAAGFLALWGYLELCRRI